VSQVDQMDQAGQSRQNRGTAENQAGSELTETDRLVVASVCLGLKNKQIADLLGVTDETVREHVASICCKLSVADRLELIIHAFRHGIAPLHQLE
jgi:DNA-binding NarL/FixJ family response regulator